LKKLSTGRSLASLAVSPAGKGHMGAAEPSVNTLFENFSKFPTTYAGFAPKRESPRGRHMGRASPTVNSLF
jgi:hypothetical protein